MKKIEKVEKVIKEHSTIGIVVTTDGSFGEISRSNYIEAATRIVNELKEIGKPFIVIFIFWKLLLQHQI